MDAPLLIFQGQSSNSSGGEGEGVEDKISLVIFGGKRSGTLLRKAKMQ